ncbi:MAG: FG-GAP repeat protein [Rhodanobacteraceae bacterium]|nr:FG-GAP repeat protein [Rhodanobacteraceae bacterium]
MKAVHTVGFGLLCFSAAQTSEAQFVHTLNGGSGFGWAVSDLSDLDADGVTDLAIASSTGSGNAGSVSLYSGRSGLLLRTLNSSASRAGYSVADAGDVNGDGLPDVLTGNPNADGRNGAAELFSGATGQSLLQLTAHGPLQSFGAAVSGAGDHNGDGKADLLIGAPGGMGRAFLVNGADGIPIRQLDAPAASTRFGAGVASVTDLNGDGKNELLVSAPGEGAGAVYLISSTDFSVIRRMDGDPGGVEFGTYFVADVGDINGDQKPDIYVGDYAFGGTQGRAYVFSGADGSRLHRFSGVGGEGMGPGRGARDVDGDGRNDIVVGSYTFSSAGLNGRGRISVFSGRTGEALARYEGPIAGGNFGFDAIGIGDANNDGKFDFLVGAQPNSRAYVVAGTTPRAAAPTFSIGAGMTGAWFDPAQSGHGLFVEILPENRILAWWFSFDAQGNQAWFGGVGTYSGNTATIEFTRTQGGRFIPNFNSANITNPRWGTVVMTFDNCSSGRINFSAEAGFGVGSMPLSRLTAPLGLVCQ